MRPMFIAGGFLALVIGWLLTQADIAAADMLSGGEIQRLIAGNSVEGAMEGSGAYAEYYAADGTIRGKDYTGAWTIDGDAMCFQYGSDPAACWQVAKDGKSVQWLKDGKIDGTGVIVPGNPNNF